MRRFASLALVLLLSCGGPTPLPDAANTPLTPDRQAVQMPDLSQPKPGRYRYRLTTAYVPPIVPMNETPPTELSLTVEAGIPARDGTEISKTWREASDEPDPSKVQVFRELWTTEGVYVLAMTRHAGLPLCRFPSRVMWLRVPPAAALEMDLRPCVDDAGPTIVEYLGTTTVMVGQEDVPCWIFRLTWHQRSGRFVRPRAQRRCFAPGLGLDVSILISSPAGGGNLLRSTHTLESVTPEALADQRPSAAP